MRRWSRVGLRARLTFIATAALAVGLAAGSLLLLRGFATSRLHAIDSSIRNTSNNISSLAAAGALPPTLPTQSGENAQVITSRGAVLAVSPGTSHTLPLVSGATLVHLAQTGPRSAAVDQVANTGLNRVLVRPVAVGGGSQYVVVTESLQDERATIHSLGRFVGIAAPVLLLVVGGILWLLLGRALGTVSALGKAAEDVTDPGGGVRLPLPDSRDEVRALAVTLNAMLDRLDAAAARERQFVGDVAHELRSPIAAMNAQLEVAAAHDDPEVRQELLAGCLADTQRLALLVDDLLVLARMESETPTDARPVDLAELAGVASAAPVLVRGDRAALARAIDNLVANANRHARSRVVVDAGPGELGLVEVRVDDDGHGVPVEDRSRVFERFVRLDDARARDHGGSGLGLAIVRATARAHGGTIHVEDSPLGGARFVLTLPTADG
jgi:signal transduction histidine kinase